MNKSSLVAPGSWSPSTVALVSILAVSLGLRVWGIWFGLPLLFHNDEGNEVVRALQLGTGEFNFGRIGKGGYFYLLFVEYGILFVVLKLAGIVSTANDFGEYYFRDPTAFYLLGRATTAVIGTLTVYLVYRIGKLSFGTAAALFAAAFLTVNVLHADLSHYVTVDVPMVCLAVASLYFAIKMATGGTVRDYWWAALLAALATTTKIPAVLLLLPLLLAHFYYVSDNGGGVGKLFFGRELWQAVVVFVVAYVITTPGIVIYYESMFGFALGVFGIDTAQASQLVELPDTGPVTERVNLFVFYFEKIVASMTWPLFIVCVAGMVYGVWKHQRADLILMSFALITYLAASSSTDEHAFFPRYMLPVIPVMVLMGGRLLADSLKLVASARYSIVAVVVIVALGVLPTSQIAANDYLISQKDTRAIAKTWIEANIPSDSKIMIEGSRVLLFQGTVPLRFNKESLLASRAYYRANKEPGKARYVQMQINILSGASYDLLTVDPSEMRDWQYYKQMGAQYIVARPGAFPQRRRFSGWPQLIKNFRNDPDVTLLQRFDADPKSAPGPNIEIYRVDSNAEKL